MKVTIQGAYITAAGTICAAVIVGLMSRCTYNKEYSAVTRPLTTPRIEDEVIRVTPTSQTDYRHEPSTLALVALLKRRAQDVVKQLDLERHELLNIQIAAFARKRHKLAPSPSPLPTAKKQHLVRKKESLNQVLLTDAEVALASLEIVDNLQTLKTEFLRLHRQHIEALSSNQPALAHELHAQIQFLLLTKHRAIYEEAGAVVTTFDGAAYYFPPAPIRIGSWDIETADLDLQDKYP